MMMNRPKLEDYKVCLKDGTITSRYVEYSTYLDIYCDKLEKALDKACELLEEGYGNEYAEDIDFETYKLKDQWKEWLMNESNN